MRAVVQRVSRASVSVDGETIGKIGPGLMVLLGVGLEDSEKDVDYLVDKIVNLRIFQDEHGKMNISLLGIGGEMLVVSQFTLYGDCRKGKRPSYDKAARPETAEAMYEKFNQRCRDYGIKVETGKFQAMMKLDIVNEGPVTLILDSKREF